MLIILTKTNTYISDAGVQWGYTSWSVSSGRNVCAHWCILYVVSGSVPWWYLIGKIFFITFLIFAYYKKHGFHFSTFHQFHDLDTELDLHPITSGFHGVFATDVTCQQGTLILPNTWFRPVLSSLLGLAYAAIVETTFPELAVPFLDFSPRVSRGTFSVLLISFKWHCWYSINVIYYWGEHHIYTFC